MRYPYGFAVPYMRAWYLRCDVSAWVCDASVSQQCAASWVAVALLISSLVFHVQKYRLLRCMGFSNVQAGIINRDPLILLGINVVLLRLLQERSMTRWWRGSSHPSTAMETAALTRVSPSIMFTWQHFTEPYLAIHSFTVSFVPSP